MTTLDAFKLLRNEKGALAHSTTGNAVLDYFSKAGALRGQDEHAFALFTGAFLEDPLRALKTLFWARDIRGGAGERRQFRDIFRMLATRYPDVVIPLLPLVSEYGRWDDMWELLDVYKVNEHVRKLIKDQLDADWNAMEMNQPVSLLAKWLPSENASSPRTKDLAKLIRRYIYGDGSANSKRYRQTLSRLRKYIGIVEQKMSSGDWESIDFSNVPSKAMLQYRKAFAKHDPDRFQEFLTAVDEGEAEIKTGTLAPYELLRKLVVGGHYSLSFGGLDRTVEAQWANMPDYLDGANPAIVVADVSGSMFQNDYLPILNCVALSIYMAERLPEPYKNKFITFSNTPTFIELPENGTLVDKANIVSHADWKGTTNVLAVFKKLLKMAVDHNLGKNQVPVVVVISDMQFDPSHSGAGYSRRGDSTDAEKTTFGEIDQNYREAGYDRPPLVWWNLRASSGFVVEAREHGNIMVSGFSPAIAKAFLGADLEKLSSYTPEQAMLDTLDGERYQAVTLPEGFELTP